MPDHDRCDIGWNFNNTYAELPKILFEQVEPARVTSSRVSVLNYPLADQLGLSLNKLPEEDAASLFSGQRLPHGALPIAQAYAGHQFGGFTMLGDGRAILVGEQCALAVSCSTFNSRVRERLLSHAAGMARPRWVRCCASTLSARRCTPWVSRRRAV